MVPMVRCAICHHRCHGVFGAELRRRNQDDLCVRNVHHDEFPRRHGDHAVHRAAAEPHHQRVNANAFRNVGGQIGVIASGMLTLPLVNLIGGGNQQLGFTVTMIIYGVICVGLLLLTFANTRERVFTPKEKEPPFIKSFVAMLHNGPWWILVTLNLVMFIGNQGLVHRVLLQVQRRQRNSFLFG